MTKADPRELEARELDALVAERFGFKPRITWAILTADKSAMVIDFDRQAEAREYFATRAYPHAEYHVGELKHWPEFSTDIACVFQLLSRFNDGPWSIVRSDHSSAKDTPYVVSLGRHEGRHSSRIKNHSAEAETLPRAICLAALAASSTTPEERNEKGAG